MSVLCVSAKATVILGVSDLIMLDMLLVLSFFKMCNMEHVKASCIDVFCSFPDICVTFVKVFDTFSTPSFVFNHAVVLGTFVSLRSFPQIWQEAQNHISEPCFPCRCRSDLCSPL
jgi:hypothetical protein